MKQSPRSISPQIIIGLIIVGVGTVLMLSQFGLIRAEAVFQFFPSLFIVLGIWQIVNNGFQHWVGPAIMIGIATVLQLSSLGILREGAVWQLWPLVLIAIGASILMRQRGESDILIGGGSERHDNNRRFNSFAMFGGSERQITSQSFEGGDVTVMFGGSDIDLHQAQVANRPAVINIFAMFGGIGIKASPDQLISLQVTAIFGGAGDTRKQRKQLADEQADYVVRGFVMFGGLEIEPA